LRGDAPAVSDTKSSVPNVPQPPVTQPVVVAPTVQQVAPVTPQQVVSTPAYVAPQSTAKPLPAGKEADLWLKFQNKRF